MCSSAEQLDRACQVVNCEKNKFGHKFEFKVSVKVRFRLLDTNKNSSFGNDNFGHAWFANGRNSNVPPRR